MSGETKGERMSLTKVDRDNLRETARTKYSLEPDGSCGNRLAHASRDILALLDALEERERALVYAKKMEQLQKEVADNQTWHVKDLKAQLATVEGERDEARYTLQVHADVLGETVHKHEQQLATAQETIAREVGNVEAALKTRDEYQEKWHESARQLDALRATYEKTAEALRAKIDEKQKVNP